MRTMTPGLSALLMVAQTSTAQHEIAPRALTTKEIRKLLPGSYVQEIVPAGLQDLSTPETFATDGRHIEYADNREIEGRYTIDRALVCVKDEVGRKYCRFMLVDNGGQYYFKGVAPPATKLIPIKIIPK